MASCHRKIRDNLALAHRLATETGHPADEVRASARRIRRYFSLALPLHTADEDHSIAPRLYSASPVLAVTLDVVTDQHRSYQPLVDWLVELCARLEEDPNKLPYAKEMVGQTLGLLSTLFNTHLDLEEQVVFPAIRRLPPEEQANIVAEMRLRRTTA